METKYHEPLISIIEENTPIKSQYPANNVNIAILHDSYDASIRQQVILGVRFKPDPDNFSIMRGYRDNLCKLNDTTEITFLNYRQDCNIMEGRELDLVIFEGKPPIGFIESSIYKVLVRGGKVLWSLPWNGKVIQLN